MAVRRRNGYGQGSIFERAHGHNALPIGVHDMVSVPLTSYLRFRERFLVGGLFSGRSVNCDGVTACPNTVPSLATSSMRLFLASEVLQPPQYSWQPVNSGKSE
jgi:hypothetical protein